MAGETTTTTAAVPAAAPAAAAAPASETTTTAAAPVAAPAAAPAESESLLNGKTDVKPEPAKDAKPEAKAEPAPVEIKIPDGFDAKDPALAEFKKIAGESGLKSEQAQKIADLYFAAQKPLQQAIAENEAEQKAWQDAVKKDPEIGGSKLEATLKVANAAVAKFGGPELGKFLAESGLGNNPLLVKAFYLAGKALAEDSTAGATPTSTPKPVDALAVMYPSMQPKA